MPARPVILVFDSGLGGLTVYAQIAQLRPDSDFVYLADDAVFPYGRLAESALVARVGHLMESAIARLAPDLVVIACNTASTLVLPHLRATYPDIPFVGTVPAIKPAAETSQSRLISVLATPGTVARDYTRGLVASFAAHCDVTLVGSARLAPLAEAFMRGDAVADADIAAEILPCFVTRDDRRTDTIVLACTHYPLLVEHFTRLAPWPVRWIDPAPAIARRVDQLLGPGHSAHEAQPRQSLAPAVFTSGRAPDEALVGALARYGLVVDADLLPAAPV